MKSQDIQTEIAEDDEIDFRALAAVLWSGKIWIAASVAVAVTFATAYLLKTPTIYQADALLQLEAGKSSLSLPETVSNILGNNEPSTLAEMEILRSRYVLGRAVADLGLDWRSDPILTPLIGSVWMRMTAPQQRPVLRVSYLEVPPDWMDQPMILTKTGELSYTVQLPDGNELEGTVGRLTSSVADRFAVNVQEMRGGIDQSYRLVHRSELVAIESLSGALAVSERGKQTGILEVTLKDKDKIAARDQLNAVLNAYIDQNISKSAAEAQKSLEFVNSQLPVAQQALNTAEKTLNDYRQSQNSVDLAFETQSLLTETSSIEAKLRDLKLQEEGIKEKYTPNHPLYRQLLEQRASLDQRLAQLQGGITALPETQREVVNLTRNLELAQTAYVELLRRSQELRVMSASQIGSARIIDSAAVQAVPVAPKKKQILVMAALLGLICGVAGVLIRNWLRRGIDSVQEIERLGIPVFATVNLYKVQQLQSQTPLLIAETDPDDIVVESFRSLRTSLHFWMLDGNSKSIVFTSSAPNAGKSFIAANLAAVAGLSGQRVCLIDGDMRRGTLHKYFGLQKSAFGLSSYLANDQDVPAILTESGVMNVSLILSGPIPPNPSELLMRSRMTALIEQLEQDFDLIIVDTPPVLAVTDAVIIGRVVGSVITVVRHDVTPINELASVRSALESAGVELKGAILNAFNPNRARDGAYSYGYRYSYRSNKT